ncbi:MAG: DUF6375 family protein [Desulfobacula sp.]|jgi:hypothetical protein|nr:DUF6375 family protein [Desulfobacula sp.]
MKIWHGYGSEHSMNLVMIGHFKNTEDSKKTHSLIEKFSKELPDKIDIGTNRDRFEDDVLQILRETECHGLGPIELEQFLYEVSVELNNNQLILRTDETDISAFMKLMIDNGAKVEIFSAHDYPIEKGKEE